MTTPSAPWPESMPHYLTESESYMEECDADPR